MDEEFLNYTSFLDYGSISPHATIRRPKNYYNSRKSHHIRQNHHLQQPQINDYASSTLRVRGKHANLSRLKVTANNNITMANTSDSENCSVSPFYTLTRNPLKKKQHNNMVFSEYRNISSPVPVVDENFKNSKIETFQKSLSDILSLVREENNNQQKQYLSNSDITIVSDLSRNNSMNNNNNVSKSQVYNCFWVNIDHKLVKYYNYNFPHVVYMKKNNKK